MSWWSIYATLLADLQAGISLGFVLHIVMPGGVRAE